MKPAGNGRTGRSGTTVRIEEVPAGSRATLLPLIEECFSGLYRLHAGRTLGSVPWVLAAFQGDEPGGLVMLSQLGAHLGYIYYVAVAAAGRNAGLGGLLLDSGLRRLRAEGAQEAFACVREHNAPMVRLLETRGFRKTGFRALARQKGLCGAMRLMARMVAAPGERVFVREPVD